MSFFYEYTVPALKKQRTSTTSQLSISHNSNAISKEISFIPKATLQVELTAVIALNGVLETPIHLGDSTFDSQLLDELIH